MRRALPPALAAVLLLAPAFGRAQTDSNAVISTGRPSVDKNSPLLTPEQQGQQGVVHGVVEQPFRDFNVIRTKIPPVLLRAIADPYERPQPPTCAGLSVAVSALDDALGPDLDEPVSTEHPGTLTRAEGSARTGALDAMRSGVQSEIPFDGFIRVLTGAQRHDKLVMAAIQAGAIRRGYLKGLGESLRCTLPAAPRHLAHPIALISPARGAAR